MNKQTKLDIFEKEKKRKDNKNHSARREKINTKGKENEKKRFKYKLSS